MVQSSRTRSGSTDSLAKLGQTAASERGASPKSAKKVKVKALKKVAEVEEEDEQNKNASDGDDDETDMALSKISVDPSSLNNQDIKELQATVRVLENKISEFRDKVSALRDFFKGAKVVRGDEIVDYLTTKQQMLLAYCVNLLFYLGMRVDGESVENHPVMQQLLRLRLALEKMRAIDGKIKHQVERLLQSVSAAPVAGEADSAQPTLNVNASVQSLRPNPLALLGKDSGSEGNSGSDDSEEESEVGQKSKRNKSRRVEKNTGATHSRNRGDEMELSKGEDKGIYRAPRMEAVPYLDNDSKAEKEQQRLDRKRQKLRSSEIFEALREEFSTAPEASGSGGISSVSGEAKKLREEALERQNYEEDRFTRLTMSRKDKKDIKSRQKDSERLDHFGDIGGMQDFDELIDLYDKVGASRNESNVGSSGKKNKSTGREDGASSASLKSGYERNEVSQSKRDRAHGKHMRDLGSAVNTSAAIERAAMAFSKVAATDTGISPKKSNSSKKKKRGE